jgi:hypothetical protein
MAVEGPVIVACAALGGSLVGGCSSVAATFIGQRLQARWARLRAELEEHGVFSVSMRDPNWSTLVG